MWLSVIGDYHDSICSCYFPFAHLLDLIFPEGHKDKDLTIRQIINRDYLQCLSGGDGDGDTGGPKPSTSAAAAAAGPPDDKEPDIDDIEVAALVAAAEHAEKR